MQKSESFKCQVFIKLEKPHFALFCPKYLKTRFLPRIPFKTILRLHVFVISCKKSGKFHELICHKTSFWAHIPPIGGGGRGGRGAKNWAPLGSFTF